MERHSKGRDHYPAGLVFAQQDWLVAKHEAGLGQKQVRSLRALRRLLPGQRDSSKGREAVRNEF